MEIDIQSLISIEKLINESESVFKIVDDIGKVLILKDNKPAYIILKYDENLEALNNHPTIKSTHTLQEAMKMVLSGATDKTLHASELADIIYDKKLYTQKNGDKAKPNQIRARCGHYPDMFEALPGNNIQLKDSIK